MTTKGKTESVATRQKAPEKSADEIEKREWLAIRKKAGRKIDPETSEVMWDYGEVMDPYGIHGELSCIGRNYFARSLGSDVWVSFYDLPKATRDALWKKHRARLAFPAGFKQKST